tara:strand:- start:1529 stop:1717 length:189 start_codon:yes stop_codon:yes gene_type:complete
MKSGKSYNTRQVAEMFKVKVPQVRVWVNEKRIEAWYTGTGRIQITQAEVDRWMKERARISAA